MESFKQTKRSTFLSKHATTTSNVMNLSFREKGQETPIYLRVCHTSDGGPRRGPGPPRPASQQGLRRPVGPKADPE